MKICKWAGDAGDEYCKSCDGIKMMVEGIEKSCVDCAGYEEGTEDVDVEETTQEEEQKPVEKPAKSTNKQTKTTKTTNTTPKEEKPVKTAKNNVEKVSEEKAVEEETSFDASGVMVTSIRYTSSCTVKKGDNYYKFTAEEEWSTSLQEQSKLNETREMLWAKLNSEVDKQIEDLQGM